MISRARPTDKWPVPRAIGIYLFGVLFGAAASALDRDRAITELHHTAWRAKDGAPSQISALAQTADGYLWIGSARGLFRFDGVQFEPYVPPPGVRLPSHNIYALLATPDGGLWISFRPSGLGFLKGGRMTVFTRPKELPRSQVYALARDHEGRIWVGTHDGLALREGSRWTDIGPDWSFTPARVRSLFVDRDGTLWVATDDAVAFLLRGSKAFQSTGVHGAVTTHLAQARDGRLWMADDAGAGPLPLSPRESGAPVPKIPLAAIQVMFDREGSLWITVFADGVRRVRFPERLQASTGGPGDAGLDAFRERDGLSADSATGLLEDREGNIWVTTAKGLDRFRHSQLVPVSLPTGHQNLTLLAGENGDVWAASAAPKPLLHIRDRRVSVEGGAGGPLSSVHRDAGGVVWWGGYGGIVRQTSGRFERFSQPENTKPDFVWEIFRSDVEGGVWVGLGDVGLVHFQDGAWNHRATPAGLLERVPSASYEDPVGRIWLGYTENRVRVLDGGRVRSYSSDDGLDIGRIRVIRGRGPTFWLGGELGLAVFRDGRFWTIQSASGEPFGTVSGIVETADGSLWLNEMRSIVHIASDEARKAADDPRHTVMYERFDFLDGLPGAGQMNWTVSTAVQATDGRLWFATDNGLARIDPARITKNTVPPPVSIRSINADGKTYEALGSLRLPQGTASLRIDYTALSLSIPERVRFRYRLEGLDDEWRDAGTRRVAFYTNPAPGKYQFRVIASNNDGVWNETGAAAEFSIAPAFYQTTWFLLLCVAAAALLAWAAYQRRVHKVMARLDMQFEERLSERTRIARELHDTLLQSFQGLMLHFQKARNLLPSRPADALQTLEGALDRADQAITEGRDAIQDIRSTALVGADLAHAISALGEELAGEDVGTSPTFQVAVEGKPRPLNPVLRDEIYRIAREALRNAFRHARASRIETEIAYGEQLLRLRIRDDGSGIDPRVLDQGGRAGHWGLVGMRERAERTGLQLDIWSREGAGTEVEARVSGSIAYDVSSARPRFRLFRRAMEKDQERG